MSHHHAGVIKHETEDPSVKGLYVTILICFVSIALIIFGTLFYFQTSTTAELNRKQHLEDAPLDLARLRAYEDERLNRLSYDAPSNTYTIPIDLAMDIVVREHSL